MSFFPYIYLFIFSDTFIPEKTFLYGTATTSLHVLNLSSPDAFVPFCEVFDYIVSKSLLSKYCFVLK